MPGCAEPPLLEPVPPSAAGVLPEPPLLEPELELELEELGLEEPQASKEPRSKGERAKSKARMAGTMPFRRR